MCNYHPGLSGTLLTAFGLLLSEVGVNSKAAKIKALKSATEDVATTVSDISLAAAEQARGIEEMSQAVAHLDEMTQKNAGLSEESAAAAVLLQQRLGELSTLVAAFRTGETAPAAHRSAPPRLSRAA